MLFTEFSDPLKSLLILLLSIIIEPPDLESSKTDPAAGFLFIADKFPPNAPNEFPIDKNRALPISSSKE